MLKDALSINLKNMQQLTSVVRLRLLSKNDSLILFKKWLKDNPSISAPLLLSLLYDLLEDFNEIPTYEFSDFSKNLLPFLQSYTNETLLNDFQLIKRLNVKLFLGLRGRFPELEEYLFNLKLQFSEKCILEELN